MTPDSMTVGVISDTHGLLREQVFDVFKKVDLILHAGDMGGADIVRSLEKLAPVKAVQGNVDKGEWAQSYGLTQALDLNGLSIYMYHGHLEQTLDLSVFDVVISGHSHQPVNETRAGVLYLNPGSAGPKRFSLPVSLAKLTLKNATAQAELINLV